MFRVKEDGDEEKAGAICMRSALGRGEQPGERRTYWV